MIDGLKGARRQPPSNTEILGLLLDEDNINLKTDLNIKRIKTLLQLKWFEISMNLNPNENPLEKFNKLLEYYKQLLVSDKRMSRTETIDGLKGIQEQEDQMQLSNLAQELNKK